MARTDTADAACSTSATAFAAYGIGDGTDLIHRSYYRLRDRGRTVEATPAFLDRLTRAFRVAFVRGAREPVVPKAVEAALGDARATTGRRFRDRGAVDLRYDLLPAFYRTTAGFHCRYAGAGADWLDGQE